MSLAALGCNPDRTTTVAEFVLGTLGYSNDGGIYAYVHAQGAIDKWGACIIRALWEALPVTTNNGTAGGNIVIPQIAFADNDFGWAMVQGTGRVRTDGSGTASEALGTHTVSGELQGTTTNLVAGILLTAADSANDGPMICMFPKIVS